MCPNTKSCIGLIGHTGILIFCVEASSQLHTPAVLPQWKEHIELLEAVWATVG
jgi:hypothetical protein